MLFEQLSKQNRCFIEPRRHTRIGCSVKFLRPRRCLPTIMNAAKASTSCLALRSLSISSNMDWWNQGSPSVCAVPALPFWAQISLTATAAIHISCQELLSASPSSTSMTAAHSPVTISKDVSISPSTQGRGPLRRNAEKAEGGGNVCVPLDSLLGIITFFPSVGSLLRTKKRPGPPAGMVPIRFKQAALSGGAGPGSHFTVGL